MKATWVKVNGTWKKVKNVWVKVNGVWKQKVIPKGKILGIWKEFISYVLNWRVEVDMGGSYDSLPDIQVDSEGNSYFMKYAASRYALLKYSPDGKLLNEVELTWGSISGWHLEGSYIYFQNLSVDTLERMNINTLERTRVAQNVPRIHNHFIKVDELNDIVILGLDDYSMRVYKLSTGQLLKAKWFPVGFRLIGYDNDAYYCEQIFESSGYKYYVTKYNHDDSRLWEYTTPAYQTCYPLGQGKNYIYYLLFRSSVLGWSYYKINKNTGQVEITDLQTTQLAAYNTHNGYTLGDVEDAFYVMPLDANKLLVYSVSNFALLKEIDMNLGAHINYNKKQIKNGYIYFASNTGKGSIPTQLWGKEELI